MSTYTPSIGQIQQAAVDSGYYEAAEVDRAIREHVAAEIEKAADEAERHEKEIHGSAHWDSDVLDSIRDRASRIREGKQS